ncbi:MAG TPA: hypothetical protein VEI97_14115 [bacterium]|nr:hypothetical protein [bacterium]
MLEPPAAGPTSAPVSPAAAAEPAPAAPEPPFESDGEDKFREIREKALGALAGLFGPTAQVETPTPVKVEGPAEVPAVPTPPPPPASSAGGWGNLKSESTLPTTPPPLPPVEGGELQAGPPAPELAGGGPEYYAAGEAVYNLRMELGLTLKDFWSKAFKGVDPNQAMDLGEAVEREEEPLEEAEVVRLAKGLEMPLEELLARFRPA